VVQHLTKRKPRKLDWYIREALQNQVQDLIQDPLGDEEFPPPFDMQKDLEPIGMYFQRYQHWERVEESIEKLVRENDFILDADEEVVGASSRESPDVAMGDEASSDVCVESLTEGLESPSPTKRQKTGVASFGGQVWGRQIGALSKMNLHSLHVSTLTTFQHQELLKCYAKIMEVDGASLSTVDLTTRLVHLWNSLHVDKLNADNYGLGGYMKESTVKKFLEDEANKIMQGDIGVHSTPHVVGPLRHAPGYPLLLPRATGASFPTPQPALALSGLAAASCHPTPTAGFISYQPLPQRPPPTAVNHRPMPNVDTMSWRDLQDWLKHYHLPVSRSRPDMVKRLKAHLSVVYNR